MNDARGHDACNDNEKDEEDGDDDGGGGGNADVDGFDRGRDTTSINTIMAMPVPIAVRMVRMAAILGLA